MIGKLNKAARRLGSEAAKSDVSEISRVQQTDNSYSSNPLTFYSSKLAFTLAEVLITLAVVGVVAAMTLPVLITNINNRVYQSRQENISYKVSQAIYKMKALGLLNTTYPTTDAFVDELQKHLKIAKRCDAEHLTECWPTEKVTRSDKNIYEVKDAKTGKDLHVYTNNTDNVGLVLADGASLILTYNENSKGVDIGDINENATNLIDFVMDVNGKKGPNRENTGEGNYDIRSYRSANFGGCTGRVPGYGCVVNFGTDYDCINEGDYQNNDNCWAGARDKCSSIGMRLLNFDPINHCPKLRELNVSGSWTRTSGLYFFCNYSNNNFGGGYMPLKVKYKALCVE